MNTNILASLKHYTCSRINFMGKKQDELKNVFCVFCLCVHIVFNSPNISEYKRFQCFSGKYVGVGGTLWIMYTNIWIWGYNQKTCCCGATEVTVELTLRPILLPIFVWQICILYSDIALVISSSWIPQCTDWITLDTQENMMNMRPVLQL